MGVDHCGDGAVSQLCGDEVVAVSRGLRCCERVDDNPTCIAPNEGDVRDVVSANLVHVGAHFEQAVNVVQLCMTPQAGVHRGRRWRVGREKVVVVDIDDGATVFVNNVACGVAGNVATRGPLKIPLVINDRHHRVLLLRMDGCGLVLVCVCHLGPPWLVRPSDITFRHGGQVG